jgi:hypothetical protein
MLEIYQNFFMIYEIKLYLKEQLLENEKISKNILENINEQLLFWLVDE